jgi:hypothetical protein
MFLMNRNILLKSTLLAAFSFTLFACGSGAKDENNENAADSTATSQDSSSSSVESAPSYTLPSPLQIAAIFKKSGLKYVEGLTNPTANISKYNSNTSKALALGIYSSDLCYNVLNKQTQNSTNYLKAARELGTQLGMESVFGANNLNQRFEKNIDKEDSLPMLIAELQLQTDMYLEDNEKEHVSAIVFSGAWIESMYIGGQVYEKTKDEKISSKISEQMTILESITKVLKSYEQRDAAIPGILADLNSIKDLYMSFDSVKKVSGSENEDAEVKLSADELAQLSKKISEARTKFING